MKEELKMFVPNKQYWVTQSLVLINVVIYILMVVSGVDAMEPSVEDLIAWGGNIDVLFGEGEYWRLFTSCFIHIGAVHLLMNMYALLFIGVLLEPVIGHKRFLFAYIVTGLISSLASVIWNTYLVSAGASGAIFGMYGVFLALLVSKRIVKEDTRKDMLTSILIFVGYNLLYGLNDEVDNAGHIGGLLSGLIVGVVYILYLTKGSLKTKMPILESGLPLVLLGIVFLFAFYTKNNETSLYIKDSDFFNELIDMSNRADEELMSEQEITSALLRKKKIEAYKIRIDSCFQKLDRYFAETDTPEPVFTNLYEYFQLRVSFVDLYNEYEESGYEPSYEERLNELDNKIGEILEELEKQYI